MNWHQSRLCLAILLWVAVFCLFVWVCFGFCYCFLVCDDFVTEALNLQAASSLQHAIERVGLPGGSHEGVGREKKWVILLAFCGFMVPGAENEALYISESKLDWQQAFRRGPLLAVQKRQCVHGTESETAAVSCLQKWQLCQKSILQDSREHGC